MVKQSTEKALWTTAEKQSLLFYDAHWSTITPFLAQSCPGRRPKGFFIHAAQYIGNKNPKHCKATLQKLLKKAQTASVLSATMSINSRERNFQESLHILSDDNSDSQSNAISEDLPGILDVVNNQVELEQNDLRLLNDEPANPQTENILFNYVPKADVNILQKPPFALLASDEIVLDSELSLIPVQDSRALGNPIAPERRQSLKWRHLDARPQQRRQESSPEPSQIVAVDFDRASKHELKFETPKLNFNAHYKTERVSRKNILEGLRDPGDKIHRLTADLQRR